MSAGRILVTDELLANSSVNLRELLPAFGIEIKREDRLADGVLLFCEGSLFHDGDRLYKVTISQERDRGDGFWSSTLTLTVA